MSFAAGSVIGPVLGGRLNDVYGFRQTFDFVAITSLCVTILNFVIVFVPKLFK